MIAAIVVITICLVAGVALLLLAGYTALALALHWIKTTTPGGGPDSMKGGEDEG